MRVYRIEDGIWQISLAWSNVWILWDGGTGEELPWSIPVCRKNRDALEAGPSRDRN